MAYLDQHDKRRLRQFAGPGDVLEDGEHAHFNIVALRDSRPSSGSRVFLTDTPAPNAKQRTESARRAWLADKATAYRRQAASATVPVVDASPSRSSASPTVNRGTVQTARQQWLADKASAYQRGEG